LLENGLLHYLPASTQTLAMSSDPKQKTKTTHSGFSKLLQVQLFLVLDHELGLTAQRIYKSRGLQLKDILTMEFCTAVTTDKVGDDY
jgi:hypothetical protein